MRLSQGEFMDFSLWVSDRVLSTLGISEPTVVDYMISAAKSSSSGEKLFQDLVKVADIPDSPQVHAFLAELVERVPRPLKASAARKKKVLEKTDMLSKNMKFSLLDESEIQSLEEIKTHTERAFHPRKKQMHESDEESESSLGKNDQDEDIKAMQDDIRERDEFAARLKERDKKVYLKYI